MTSDELECLYSNRIGKHSILCTDSHKRIKRGRHKEDIYHIQHINGVATKYLSNYLKWNKWINIYIHLLSLYIISGIEIHK